MTSDSHSFNSSVKRRHFKDVAGVAGNRCIERGSSSKGVDRQVTVGIFSRPGYKQKYLPFPDVARNKRHAQHVATLEMGSLNSMQIRYSRYGDIRALAKTGSRWVPSAGNCVIAGEVWKTTPA